MKQIQEFMSEITDLNVFIRICVYIYIYIYIYVCITLAHIGYALPIIIPRGCNICHLKAVAGLAEGTVIALAGEAVAGLAGNAVL